MNSYNPVHFCFFTNVQISAVLPMKSSLTYFEPAHINVTHVDSQEL